MTSRNKRSPRAFTPDDTKLVSREHAEPVDPEVIEIAPPDQATAPRGPDMDDLRRGMKWGALLLSAIGGLVLLAGGIWLNDLVTGLFARQDWVGWTALGLLGLAVLAAFMIAAREFWAILRLRRLGRIRQDAESAQRQKNRPLAEEVSAKIRALYRHRPDMAWGLSRLREHDGDIMDAEEALALVERELVSQLDRSAHSVIASTAKRVSVVTAVSPLAVLDMAIVAAQNLKMLRQVATLYGARPGTLGLFRLARMVMTHIVLTGGLALGDDLIQQLIGHRLMAKLSARLGEGLFNGALTARIGLAAMDVCRPLPYVRLQPPRIRSILAELARQATLRT